MNTIKSHPVTIAIASVAAIVSIIPGSILIPSMILVCDSVHDHSMICNTVNTLQTAGDAPTVIATVQTARIPLIIFDPELDISSGDICEFHPVSQPASWCRNWTSLKKRKAGDQKGTDSRLDTDTGEQ
jgi:hypothetical protein